jgi:DNA-binding GntR family transcriptional regulator
MVADTSVDTHPGRSGASKAAPLGEKAYEAVKTLLLEADGNGPVFSERALSKATGIGLAPVRSALARLRSEGIIVVTPQSGIRLPDLAPSAILDFYELRTVIESHVVSDLAKRGVGDLLGPARARIEAQRALVDAGDTRGYHEEDARFHLALAELHGNAEIIRVLSSLRDRMHRLSSILHDGHPERMPLNFAQHVEILEAIADGDPQAATDRLVSHLSGARDHVMDPHSRTRPRARG